MNILEIKQKMEANKGKTRLLGNKKFNWKLLKKDRCPACGSELRPGSFNDAMYRCRDCGFKISEERLVAIKRNLSQKAWI